MIELIEGLGDRVVGARAIGKVTADDYESTLIPAVETALAIDGKTRILYILGSEFEGYEGEALHWTTPAWVFNTGVISSASLSSPITTCIAR